VFPDAVAVAYDDGEVDAGLCPSRVRPLGRRRAAAPTTSTL